MNAKGSVFKYPDNVDTDVIIPARHLNTQDPKELASHCMEDIDKDFVRNVRDGDVMVGGWNFGCGSSREHAPVAIKAAGISVVIAKSFARIFYRNSINIGLPIMECPEAVDAISAGDTFAWAAALCIRITSVPLLYAAAVPVSHIPGTPAHTLAQRRRCLPCQNRSRAPCAPCRNGHSMPGHGWWPR